MSETAITEMDVWTPVTDEIEAYDLEVTGALPPELTGRYFRNGPNPLPGQEPAHLFTGHGMLHGIRLNAGKAEWYRNRWVRTGRLAGDPLVREDGTRDLAAVSANTHVIHHADRILALVESGLPHQVSPELDTVGPCDFGGRLTTAMTAHPKEDPRTGELHFFGYGVTPPFLTYHRLSAAGELVHSAEIEVPGPTMMHDFAITENHVIWLDLPVVFNHEMVGKGMPFLWDEDYGARFGVMSMATGQVRWFEVDPCYLFHVGNASEDGYGRIVLDAARYSPASFAKVWGGPAVEQPVSAAVETGGAKLHRWTIDPVSGVVREQPLDDHSIEFPSLNDTRTGRSNRYLYAMSGQRAGVLKYDLASGASQQFDLGHPSASVNVGEAVFVPAASPSSEDDGWLLSIATDRAGRRSELLVLDATNPSGSPVAAVQLPRRVPAGFHGSWIADTE